MLAFLFRANQMQMRAWRKPRRYNERRDCGVIARLSDRESAAAFCHHAFAGSIRSAHWQDADPADQGAPHGGSW
jgi:hypothetical protein